MTSFKLGKEHKSTKVSRIRNLVKRVVNLKLIISNKYKILCKSLGCRCVYKDEISLVRGVQ